MCVYYEIQQSTTIVDKSIAAWEHWLNKEACELKYPPDLDVPLSLLIHKFTNTVFKVNTNFNYIILDVRMKLVIICELYFFCYHTIQLKRKYVVLVDSGNYLGVLINEKKMKWIVGHKSLLNSTHLTLLSSIIYAVVKDTNPNNNYWIFLKLKEWLCAARKLKLRVKTKTNTWWQ